MLHADVCIYKFKYHMRAHTLFQMHTHMHAYTIYNIVIIWPCVCIRLCVCVNVGTPRSLRLTWLPWCALVLILIIKPHTVGFCKRVACCCHRLTVIASLSDWTLKPKIVNKRNSSPSPSDTLNKVGSEKEPALSTQGYWKFKTLSYGGTVSLI